MQKAAELRGIIGSLVATSIVLRSAAEQTDWASNGVDETFPANVPLDWRLLGYDVADRWLVSGLSNCGYTGRERAEWQLMWSKRINDTHLLFDVADAHEFAQATNDRVPEHSPFFVYELWMGAEIHADR